MSKVLFFSGAGLSADSGLSTFRDSNGLWDRFDPTVVCNYDNWITNYDLVHEFYDMRRVEYERAEPNKMHKLIAELQNRFGEDKVEVITQNIDNLLEKAGAKSVMHIHGHINYIHCNKCNEEYHITANFDKDMVCKKCSGKIFKPSIIFFGEMAPLYRPMYDSFSSLTKSDILIVIGTNGSVIPISSVASSVSAKKVLCNLESSAYINEKNFDNIIYDRAENAVDKIREIALSALK